MLNRLDELANQRRDFAFETTLASRSFPPRLRQLERSGYDINVVYLWLRHPKLAVDRVAERVRRGGHDVPIQTIERRYEKGLKNFFELYCPLADFWMVMDNSDPFLPEPIAWHQRGNRLIVRSDHIWQTIASTP